MRYILTGFTHDTKFRVFAFEGQEGSRLRIEYTVHADLSLVRKYGIRVQELPLLCREILDRHEGGDSQRTFTYTEADMCIHATARAAQAAARKRAPSWRQPKEDAGTAWQSADGCVPLTRKLVNPA